MPAVSRSLSLGCAALLVACAPPPDRPWYRVEVDATIRYYSFEGGFWAFRGDDGVTYDPLSMPLGYRKDGLRVHAALDMLQDVVSIRMAGPMVEVVKLDLLACDATVPCPIPYPPVTLMVYGPGGRGVPGTTLVNVIRPPVEPSEPAFQCGPADVTAVTCTIEGSVGGRYEADVAAPGMDTGRIVVDVPGRQILAGECCPLLYVPQFPQLALRPAG